MTYKKLLQIVLAFAVFLIIAVSTEQMTKRGKAVENQAKEHKYTNRLIKENSPYLLQHAHNPVNWFAWGKEAFEKAKEENKPIFISIGYSTCHWCHVMEHESFENEEIAKIMNENFISIKVDREQRPDIDSIYMNAVQAMTGSGGWPLSVFCTPEGKPFYSGTYFPPRDSFGRVGFPKLLSTIANAWQERQAELVGSANNMAQILEKICKPQGKGKLSIDLLEKSYANLESAFDDRDGGFGTAPKFPQPGNLSFVMNYWYRTKNDKALSMVEKTLDKMANGGMYDQLGGGFHRYSTDKMWLVPHFEKMLYDQALLSRVYLKAYKITGKKKYVKIVNEIFDYVLRDMTDSKGGFYSAEDADSEGSEGLFYVWELKEIEVVLGKKNADIFNDYYGVTKAGNFEEAKNILNISKAIKQTAEKFNTNNAEIEKILLESRERLFKHREKRVRPHKDDKIITAWNGLMISALAEGGAVLAEEKYIKAAETAAGFILTELQGNGRLMRYYRKGKAVGYGFLDDYAFTITGLLDLYEATFDAKWLEEAKKLTKQMTDLFEDKKNGGFFQVGRDSEQLIVHNKPSYDGAVPSGNSIAVIALLRLGKLTMDSTLTEKGEKLLENFSGQLAQSPTSFTTMLRAVDFLLGPSQEIVITGAFQEADTQEMIKLIRGKFLPNAVVIFHDTGKEGKAIEKIAPFVVNQTAIAGKATAYVCENFACKKPTNDINELESLL
ncbi:MAG: thioredoxin domain-containing protein [Planctomycetota bacterium]|jgi:uncharacterized protein YyaL (SSP411 family)